VWRLPLLRQTYHAAMPLSRAPTRGRYSRIVGVTSWYQSHPRLRSPLLDRIANVVESRTKMFWVLELYISESRILFTPQSLRPSGEASWRRVLTILSSNFMKKLGSRGYLGIIPIVLWQEHCSWCLLTFRGCGSVPGSWAPRCCRHNFIVAVLEYLSFADIEISFMQLLVRSPRRPPVLGREFGSIAITCITDVFQRLR